MWIVGYSRLFRIEMSKFYPKIWTKILQIHSLIKIYTIFHLSKPTHFLYFSKPTQYVGFHSQRRYCLRSDVCHTIVNACSNQNCSLNFDITKSVCYVRFKWNLLLLMGMHPCFGVSSVLNAIRCDFQLEIKFNCRLWMWVVLRIYLDSIEINHMQICNHG